ncbi:hypothetical protein PMIN06_003558 [Paraphaeosphaeria minitans]|uniref:Epoxide hydrolase n=1 Tax=Paraphaeosphaeria minitans TaxID=565426 RepID=A0A9P6GR24_9PLEO|nr:putative epoxide hydrolase [Paraphaeosphaeria minitans]
MAPPKAILFDVGGVVVLSPFQAILDYEVENHIPPGYINHAIQRGPPDTGAWQRLERGDCPLDDAWFAAFQTQLQRPPVWREYWIRFHARGGGHADPGSNGGDDATAELDAQVPPVPHIAASALFWRMMRYSRRPDAHMYAALKRLRSVGAGRWVVGALSNTVAFPPGVRDDGGAVFDAGVEFPRAAGYRGDSRDVADWFDVYLGSARMGVRKPDPEAYRLSVRELSRVAEARGLGRVEARDVLFLDDIGVNLKVARQVGMRTIKVDLGGTREAVRKLEAEVGMSLTEGKSRL